jgi:signal transduction histidine kinase
VVRNLLTNAIKFTPTGGTVTFSASSHHTNKGVTTTISISDTGVGMSPQQLQNLFRIDQHPSSRGTAGEQGNGLMGL